MTSKEITVSIYAKWPKVGYYVVRYVLLLAVAVRILKRDKALQLAEQWLRKNLQYRVGDTGEWKKAFK